MFRNRLILAGAGKVSMAVVWIGSVDGVEGPVADQQGQPEVIPAGNDFTRQVPGAYRLKVTVFQRPARLVEVSEHSLWRKLKCVGPWKGGGDAAHPIVQVADGEVSPQQGVDQILGCGGEDRLLATAFHANARGVAADPGGANTEAAAEANGVILCAVAPVDSHGFRFARHAQIHFALQAPVLHLRQRLAVTLEVVHWAQRLLCAAMEKDADNQCERDGKTRGHQRLASNRFMVRGMMS